VQYPPSPWETLSLHNLETLYHEWGHALHSILSRTSLQHLAGTRGSTDFMEVPSILFENFAKNKDVLLKWIRHPVTNKIIDENILINALSSKNNFQAMELQGQLLISAVDQVLYDILYFMTTY
jgi:intermediate peptidase